MDNKRLSRRFEELAESIESLEQRNGALARWMAGDAAILPKRIEAAIQRDDADAIDAILVGRILDPDAVLPMGNGLRETMLSMAIEKISASATDQPRIATSCAKRLLVAGADVLLAPPVQPGVSPRSSPAARLLSWQSPDHLGRLELLLVAEARIRGSAEKLASRLDEKIIGRALICGRADLIVPRGRREQDLSGARCGLLHIREVRRMHPRQGRAFGRH